MCDSLANKLCLWSDSKGSSRSYMGIKSKEIRQILDDKPCSILCLTSETGVIAYRSGILQIINPRTLELKESYQTTFSSIESIAKFTDKEFFIGGEKDIKLFDISFHEKNTFTGHTDAVVKLFMDNQVLYSASEDLSIRSWNISSGHSTILYCHESPVIAMDVSPSLKLIASSCSDSHLYIFSIAENRVIRTDKNLDSKAWSLKFISSKGLIAIGTHDSTIFIRKIQDLHAVAQLEGHESRVKDMDYFEEFDLLISVSFDQKFIIWKNFQRVESIEDHGDWIRKVSFTLDGESALSVGDDSKILSVKFEINHGEKRVLRRWLLLIWILVFIAFIALVFGIIEFTFQESFSNILTSEKEDLAHAGS